MEKEKEIPNLVQFFLNGQLFVCLLTEPTLNVNCEEVHNATFSHKN